MPKGMPNKRYTAEFKKVVETQLEEKMSYSEVKRRFGVVRSRKRPTAEHEPQV